MTVSVVYSSSGRFIKFVVTGLFQISLIMLVMLLSLKKEFNQVFKGTLQ